MLLGLLSDSHDHFGTLGRAIQILQKAGAEFLIHCGDIGSPVMLDLLAGIPSAFVFGNTDWNRPALTSTASALGVQCLASGGTLEFDGKRLFVTHGDDPALKRTILTAQAHDYFLQGHTHVRSDECLGRTRIINPGALHRTPAKTVALLAPGTGQLTFLPVP